MRLGRLPHSADRLAAIPHHMAAETPPPPIVTPPEGFRVELLDNDTLPVCVDAGLINAARVWTLKHGGFDLRYQTDVLLQFYARCAGCTVAEIGSTDGLVMLDALESAQRDGYQINDQDTLVPLFHRADGATAIRQAIASTGSAYVGVDLDEGDMSQDWTARPLGPVVGGHAIALVGYHPGGFVAATWGEERPCDEGWLMARLREAYAVSWAM